MNNPLRRTLVALIALVWLAGMVGGYFVYHAPASVGVLRSALLAGQRVLAALSVLTLCGGTGRRLLPAAAQHPLARLSVQAAAGLGVVSLVVLGLGSTLGLSPLLWAILGLAGLAFLRGEAIGWWREWDGLRRLWQAGGRLGRAIAACLAFLLAILLLTALAPPLRFDALVYHLALPLHYLQAGRVIFVPENMFWGMPQTGEMAYTLAMLFGGAPAATVLGWGFGVTAMVGVLGLAAQYLGERAAWVAGASLAAGASTIAGLPHGYVDWLTVWFGLACLACLLEWSEAGRHGALIWAGGFAGFALGTKYTAGVLALVGLAWVLGQALRQPEDVGFSIEKVIILLLCFGFPVVIVSAPWWLKNLLATGNPFYPFLFPAGPMDSLRLALYQNSQAWGDWREVLLLPLRATLIGKEGAPGYGASIGPLLLALAPFAAVGLGSRPRAARQAISAAAFLAVSGLVVWAFVSRFAALLIQTRLYFSLFPALALLAGAGFQRLACLHTRRLKLERLGALAVALALGASVVEVGLLTLRQDPLPAALGLQAEEDYRAANLGWYAPAMRAVHNLPSGSRAVMLWEARSLDCQPACEADEVLDRWIHDLRQEGSAGEVLEAWRAQGFTHALVYQTGAEFTRQEDARYRADEWQSLDALLAGLQVEQNFGDVYVLYRLREQQ